MTVNQQEHNRLEGLDLARFIAFVGMVIVNFKIVMGAEEGTGMLATFTSAFEGRAAATFVVLAGVGLGLAGQKGLNQTLWLTTKRALFLLVIGLLNMLIFEADILHYYAFYFLFGAMLLPLSTRALVGGILLLNLVFVAMILALNYDAGWNWDDYSYSGFWTPLGFIRNLFFNGWHPVIPWLGFVLFGIVLSRQSLGARRTQLILFIGGAVALFWAERASGLLEDVFAAVDPELAILATTDPVPPMPLYFIAGIGAASMVVGLCLLAENSMKRIGLLNFVAPAGRQSLTLYIAHILVGMGSLEALGLLGGQSVNQAVIAALLFCLAATLYAYLWAKVFKRGPIEAAMRKLAG